MNKLNKARVRVKGVQKSEIEVGQGSLLPKIQYSVLQIAFTDVVQIGSAYDLKIGSADVMVKIVHTKELQVVLCFK